MSAPIEEVSVRVRQMAKDADDLIGLIDQQTYDEYRRGDWDLPDDCELLVTFTAGDLRKLDRIPGEIANKVTTWAIAAPLIDFEYDNGYGGADTFPVTAWTANRVIYVSEYDGSTGVTWVPRHPIDHEPSFS